ncbi:MAG: hypothetical protein EOO11_07500 [Chitinophagaceae bacterium]|nr:MAG: hypothetical protein EOO11_07500 [Chitinophagaceae bacterium]
MKHLLNFLLCLSLLPGCKKSSGPRIDASSITATDANGVVIAADPDDWRVYAGFPDPTRALFTGMPASELSGAERAQLSVQPVAPNPTAGLFHFFINTSARTAVQLVVADEDRNVMDRFTFSVVPGGNARAFILDQNAYANGRYYRVYYGFFSESDGLYAGGHGDIRVQR